MGVLNERGFFIKAHTGWFQMSKQQGALAAKRGLIASLLCDLLILSHPAQIAAHKSKNQIHTAGSIRALLVASALQNFLETIALDPCPAEKLARVALKIEQHFKLKKSLRHVSTLEPFARSALPDSASSRTLSHHELA